MSGCHKKEYGCEDTKPHHRSSCDRDKHHDKTINVKQIKQKGKLVLDKRGNLHVKSVCAPTVRTETLCAKGDKINIQSNIQAQCIFSEDINKTQLVTFEGTGSVEILPVEKYEPATVMIKTCPCSGVIESVDPTTGVITYLPGGPAPAQDIFQYTIQDECDVIHCITQHVCQQIMSVPPFINPACLFRTPDFGPVVTDITPFVVEGSSPTDYSTLTFKSVDVFGTADNVQIPCDPTAQFGASNLPYTFPESFQSFGPYTSPVPDVVSYNNVALNIGQLVRTVSTTDWVATDNDAGTITLSETIISMTGFDEVVSGVIRITYCVSNDAGPSNDGFLYLSFRESN